MVIMQVRIVTFHHLYSDNYSVNALTKADLSCLNERTGGEVESLDMKAGVFPGEVWSASRQCQVNPRWSLLPLI